MLNTSPFIQYQNLISANKISFDDSQQQAVELLQNLYEAVEAEDTKVIHSTAIKGLYLWGKVGRGKTFLMDLFVNSLPDTLCKRQHFHHFMQDVHRQLKDLSGQAEPLKRIAEAFSCKYRVLCFDEFFVSDIGDAMLLGNLMQFMFDLNIIVVSTSNCAPSELYRNGLQRDRFLPAIAAIEQHMQTLHLAGEHDHRLRTLTYDQSYFELSAKQSIEEQVALHQSLLTRFDLKSDAVVQTSHKDGEGRIVAQAKTINILGREMTYIAKNIEIENHVICFDFTELCEGPRSHFDYIELAKQFTTILLFNVPPMSGQSYERIKARGTEDNGSNINVSAGLTGEREVMLAPMDDAARRFIALVDECYDCTIDLFITAYVPQSELYNSGSLMFEFERTKSRLVEMASLEYRNKA